MEEVRRRTQEGSHCCHPRKDDTEERLTHDPCPRFNPLIAAALLALAWTTDTRADGAVNIDACQRLSNPNTTYELTGDLTSASGEDCLTVAADRIIISTGAPRSPHRKRRHELRAKVHQR